MTAPDRHIVMSVILEPRHFQVLVIQEGTSTWFATISERASGPYRTRPLESVETQAGPSAALRLALDRILEVAGIEQPVAPTDESQPKKTIRQLREEQGWLQLDMAGRLGVSASSISLWERGLVMPSLLHQSALARLFGVSMTEIAFEQDEGAPTVTAHQSDDGRESSPPV